MSQSNSSRKFRISRGAGGCFGPELHPMTADYSTPLKRKPEELPDQISTAIVTLERGGCSRLSA